MCLTVYPVEKLKLMSWIITTVRKQQFSATTKYFNYYDIIMLYIKYMELRNLKIASKNHEFNVRSNFIFKNVLGYSNSSMVFMNA